MEVMTKDSSLYKWARKGVSLIQSGIAILSSNLLICLLFCWHWTRTTFASTTHIQNEPQITTLTVTTAAMDTYGNDSGDDEVTSDIKITITPIDNNNSDPGYISSDSQVASVENDQEGHGTGIADVAGGEVPATENFVSDCSSDISSDGPENSDNENPEVTGKLICQVESMFSDDHLAKDGFLLKHVRRRSDGFVSLKLVAGLRKVKQISRDFPTVLASLRKSSKLEVNSDGTKIRRTEPLTPYLKSLPTTGNKDKDKESKALSDGASSDSAQDERVNGRQNHQSSHSNGYQQQQRRNQRNNSIGSATGTNGNNRKLSICKPGQQETLYRNMMGFAPDEVPQGIRRRGGSLPMPMVTSAGGQQHYFRSSQDEIQQKRNSLFLSPNMSPTEGSGFHIRPKSNSYCEGIGTRSNPNGGMSLWLKRRMESSRSAEGCMVNTGPVRQPRGPDGTRGFAIGHRQLISAM